MTARAYTVAFEGIETREVEVQCAMAPGMPGFAIVGLPDKAVSEARDRVRSALQAMSIALPSKRVIVNLSPADLPKEGSHFDLPIALALLAAIDVLPREMVESVTALGELSLDGTLLPVIGALPAALHAASRHRSLICPKACGAEAAWVEAARVLAPDTLHAAIAHFTGQRPLPPAEPGEVESAVGGPDLADVRGQERAKRALEIAAAGRHHLIFVGPPGSGKSMLARRLPGLLPPMSPREALDTSMIHSLAGLMDEGGITRLRPFQEPHHTASMAAIVGGGKGAKPGQISLAHNGVLFMDEFPEYARPVLETLRQPIETGEVVIARANAHVRYPCRFLLVAAANPCRCGHQFDPARACSRAPVCGEDYMSRISGPLMDRFDLRIEVPPVSFTDLDLPPTGEPTATVAARVAAARDMQAERYRDHPEVTVNADLEGRCSTGRLRRTRLARRCFTRRPIGSASRQGATTGSCGWPARSPIWRGRQAPAASTSARHCPTASSLAASRIDAPFGQPDCPTRRSIASQIAPATSDPSKRSISWMPVGEVRLISVR